MTNAIIGGTGLSEFHHGEPIGDIATPFGDASAVPLVLKKGFSAQSNGVIFLPRHGHPHAVAPHLVNYRANLWLLKQLGVKRIVAVNAVGGIRKDLVAGTMVVPDQIIDYTYGREHTFLGGDGLSQQQGMALGHIDFTFPFTEDLRQKIIQGAKQAELTVSTHAVYGVTQGPRLETVAEINKLEADGCDIVGMTAMPEAALAREIGIDYASVCLVVNPAAGRSEGIVSLEEIHAIIASGMIEVKELLQKVF